MLPSQRPVACFLRPRWQWQARAPHPSSYYSIWGLFLWLLLAGAPPQPFRPRFHSRGHAATNDVPREMEVGPKKINHLLRSPLHLAFYNSFLANWEPKPSHTLPPLRLPTTTSSSSSTTITYDSGSSSWIKTLLVWSKQCTIPCGKL